MDASALRLTSTAYRFRPLGSIEIGEGPTAICPAMPEDTHRPRNGTEDVEDLTTKQRLGNYGAIYRAPFDSWRFHDGYGIPD